jgi:hypothetical protein
MFTNLAMCIDFLKKLVTIHILGLNQNINLEGDEVELELRAQVQASFEDHQHSVANQTTTIDVHKLSPWLRVSHWHDLAINHIIPP